MIARYSNFQIEMQQKVQPNDSLLHWHNWVTNAISSDLVNYINGNYCKNITPSNSITREINFPLPSTTWFCGEVYGNLNNYGNIAFHIAVQGSTSITKTNIIGDNTKISITIDVTNKLLKMSCTSDYSFKSITFIHS